MKIQDLSTNDSSLIELDLNKAADVHGGGYDWSPNDFYDNLEGEFGTSSFSTVYARQYPNRYTPEATLANGINSNSLAAFDRRLAGIMSFQQFM